MSWTTILVIAIGSYLLKALGTVAVQGWKPSVRTQRCLDLLPATLICAVTIVNTVVTGRHLVIDARLPAVLVAAIAVWRRAPFAVVIILSAAVAALIRRSGWLA
jgi:branched-subunit amino acid transport protein